MSELFWLTEAQVDRLRPFFPKPRWPSHGSMTRCPILFLSACALAATVIYWL